MASDKLKILFFLFSIFSYQSEISAQNKKMVKSKSYDLLLKKLLKHNVPEVSVDSLNNLQDDVLLLDAREIDEYNVSHLKNANWVGYKTFNIGSLQFTNKNQPIVVYCSVGYRSEKIAEKLINAGFTDVRNLYGGIFEWKSRKHDVYNTNGVTNDVHPFNATWGMWLKNADKVYHSSTLGQKK